MRRWYGVTLAQWFCVGNVILALAIIVQRASMLARTTQIRDRIHHVTVVVAALGVVVGYAWMLIHGHANVHVPFVQQYVLRPSLLVMMAALLASPWLGSER